MAHVSKQAVDAVVSALSGQTEAGTAVYHRRFFPAFADIASDVLVYAESEDIEAYTQAPVRYQRSLRLVVAGRFAGLDTGLEARAFTFQTLVETIVETDATLAALAQYVGLRGAATQLELEGERPVLIRFVTFQVDIHTRAGDPETAL